MPQISFQKQQTDQAGNLAYQERGISITPGEAALGIGGTIYTKSELEFSAENAPATVEEDNSAQADGVIVELLDPPASKVYAAARRRRGVRAASPGEVAAEVSKHTGQIRSKQDKVLEALERGSYRAHSSERRALRFSKTFNGFALTGVDIEEAKKVLAEDQLAYSHVKRISPNLPVKAALETSLDQIHAREVWTYTSPP